MIADRNAGLGPIAERQADVAQGHEFAGRPGQRAAGIEPGHRRQLALEGIWPGVQDDVVPCGMDADLGLVIGDREQDVVERDDHAAGVHWGRVIEGLPGALFEPERPFG